MPEIIRNEARTIETHPTLKALDDDGRIGGYLVVWGSPQQRDLQGEFFTPETELGLDWYDRRPVLYHHGQDAALKSALVGVLEALQVDEIGLWAEAQLDRRLRYFRALTELVQRGALGWSSGSLPQLREVASDGRILRWPIVEGSLTPTPAEPRHTEIQSLKSAYAALGLDSARWMQHAGLTIESNGKGNAIMNQEMSQTKQLAAQGHVPMAGGAPENEHSTQEAPHFAAEPARFSPEPARKHLPLAVQASAPRVGSPYDDLSAVDLLHGYVLLSAGRQFRGVSERYANALAQKVLGAGMTARKADELSHSTQTSFGDEWVPDLWSAQVWQQARMNNVILPLFRAIEMPSNPFHLPVEGADPTVYYVPETTDESQLTLDAAASAIPDSKIGTKKLTLTASKLALRVGFSAELVEDSIVPVLQMFREQALRAIADSIDYTLLNGDTAGGNANINRPGSASAANARYKAFDGLRKLPLVTNTAHRANANGAPTLALLRQARFSLPIRYSARPSDLVWIVDGGSYAKFLNIKEFLTMDQAGAAATAQSGQIGFADGVPVVVSAEMPLTDGSNGKVHSTAKNNTRGTALCVYRPGWYVGYRRRIAVSVDYLPYYDSYQLTTTVRLAFMNYDNDVAAALINIEI
ncbi:MAG: phage major capsid protein [Chloroflexi bacterium]|nr:phage major capsid protein [Anaerolineaceae bacterium]MCY4106412.1 phage major capsid protein [Chloroflexota bacterium]